MSKKQRAKDQHHRTHRTGWEQSIPAWLSCFFICAVGILVYSNTFQGSFHFDDETSIVNNPAIRNLTDPAGIFLFSPTRFLTYLSFAVNYGLGGLNVLGYHLVNLTVHLLSAIAVWLFVRQMVRTPSMRGTPAAQAASMISLLCGLIFVAHPVQTQAVTYIAQRAASMATLFYVLSLYLYGEGRMRRMDSGGKGAVAGFFVGSFAAGLFGMFSKETAVTLPLAIALYEISFLREGRRIPWRFIAGMSVLVVSILLVLVTQKFVATSAAGALPVSDYLLTQPRILLTYLRLFILPLHQNLDYDFAVSRAFLEPPTILGVLGLGVVILSAIALYPRQRILSFGLAWFVLTLIPESSIFPLPDVIYEHRMYLPLAGLSMVAAYLIFAITRTMRGASIAAVIVVVIGGLGITTLERNAVWRDDVTLWGDVISKSPNKARGYNNRGQAYLEGGMYDAAMLDLNRAIALDPSFGNAYNNRGNIYLMRGDFVKAIAEYQNALNTGTVYVLAVSKLLYNIGTAYMGLGEIRKAIEFFDRAIAENSNESSYFYNRGLAHTKLNDAKNTLADYDRAIALNPSYVKALNNRGVVHEQSGDLDKALADFNMCLSLDRSFSIGWINRGRVLSAKGEYQKAASDLTEAIALSPGNVELFNRRGMAFLRSGEKQKALDDFQKAVTMDPLYGEAFYNEGLALEALGRTSEAKAKFRNSARLGFKPANAQR